MKFLLTHESWRGSGKSFVRFLNSVLVQGMYTIAGFPCLHWLSLKGAASISGCPSLF